ncbi:MAG: antitoxin [Nitrospirae bacterium CG_4_10_14_0_8_um_filter_41_23]|nr:MAG: antitoxin [Nitrospirae bacterium CG11_big_fil_rev_8_21_14_0_20_41_14]PIW86660.1 MAG: antitoxin [Nitrospirae bacterium CG_4_8_14_3_um_filter_41_47]PIY85984.1 MAG: antitoxin [Nitrospirae bacterium CG_4_10_14_0_8_um_filter_41_23]PJA80384.1 MAG: antitoxin [Nitrospirae bacterium CG_4_9_14_3_um_filter_41_27]
MTVMTIRGLDDLVVKALKEKAKEEGTSVNAVLLKILKKELGLIKKSRTVIYNDLDHLAGTWSEKDYMEFQKRIEDFEKIDENLWK